jgi:hypothetical protein
VLQEGIDVLAMALALRAVLLGRMHSVTLAPADAALEHWLRVQHASTSGVVKEERSGARSAGCNGC